jgi:hypothetical protein
VRAGPHGAAIAGWEQLVVELSAAAGLRIVLVLLDAAGRPIAANDTVLHRSAAPVNSRQESLGGWFEDGGSFRGTRWDGESADGETSDWRMTKREPNPDEVRALTALVADIVQRQQR